MIILQSKRVKMIACMKLIQEFVFRISNTNSCCVCVCVKFVYMKVESVRVGCYPNIRKINVYTNKDMCT